MDSFRPVSAQSELVLGRIFASRAQLHPERPVVVDEAGGYSAAYGEHLARVRHLGVVMGRELGLHPSDRFAVVARNRHEYIELWHAALLGAGVVTPINSRLSPGEVAHILDDSGAKAVFVDSTGAELLRAAMRVAGGAPPQVVLIGSDTGVELDFQGGYDQLLAGLPEATSAAWTSGTGEPAEDQPAVLMYTGGTTGLPKGVVLSHRAQVLNQYHSLLALPVPDGWKFLQHTPLYHAGATTAMVRGPMTGATIFCIPNFEPEAFMSATRYGNS